MKLKREKLREILRKINSDPQKKNRYTSKWHKVVNFLFNSTGLKISGVKKAGSIGKQTDYNESDLDIIYCTPTDYELDSMLDYIANKAEANFGDIAQISIRIHAVQIEFFEPETRIDVVYLTEQEFKTELEEIKEIRSISQVQLDSIKLAKYAFDKANIDEINGYQIENACLYFNYDTLEDYTYHNIKHFTGIIKNYGLNINDVLKFLS